MVKKYNVDKDIIQKLTKAVKELTNTLKKNNLKEKTLIGFVSAPWTLLVYMLNKRSPKKNFEKLRQQQKLSGNGEISASTFQKYISLLCCDIYEKSYGDVKRVEKMYISCINLHIRGPPSDPNSPTINSGAFFLQFLFSKMPTNR